MDKKENRKRLHLRGAGFLLGLCLFFFFFSATVSIAAQVSLVLSSDAKPYREAADALTASLSGKSIQADVFLLEDLPAGAPSPATDAQVPEVWVAIGSRAAAHLNTFLPGPVSLVYCMVVDPKKIGLEGGRKKVSGVGLTKPVQEQFAIIGMAMPDLHSIGMLYRSSSFRSMQTLADVRKNLPGGWQLEAVDVDKLDSMAGAIRELFKRDVGMVWTMADSAVYNRATVKNLLLASLRNQTPVFGFSGSFVKAGALLGLEADPTLQGRYAASLVLDDLDRNSQDTQLLSAGVSLAVNMAVADRLGIALSDELLKQASVVGGP